LVDRLQTLLKKQETAETTKEYQNQKEYKEEAPPSSPLTNIEKHKSLKIVNINQETLKDLFIKPESVRDFIDTL
jgi:hypothetical protein